MVRRSNQPGRALRARPPSIHQPSLLGDGLLARFTLARFARSLRELSLSTFTKYLARGISIFNTSVTNVTQYFLVTWGFTGATARRSEGT
jgi:hypothetical protein